MLDLTKFKFQYITNANEKYSHYSGAKIALDGGCQWIQLRIKENHPPCPLKKGELVHCGSNSPFLRGQGGCEILDTAFELKELCNTYDATFIIDDYVEITKTVEADGVHLGKNDMPIKTAREILGNNFIIGGTANTVNDIINLTEQGANYIGLGPFKFTNTKKNLSAILGIEGYQKIFSELQQLNISIPIVAIGGITVNDIPTILNTGANGIAISSTILNSTNPLQTTIDILANITQLRIKN